MPEENKYDELRSKLRSLPRIKSRSNFNDRLMARIQENLSPAKIQKIIPNRSNIWVELISNIFRPSWTPALALSTVVLFCVVIYFIVITGNINKNLQGYKFEETPVSKQMEFVINKPTAEDDFRTDDKLVNSDFATSDGTNNNSYYIQPFHNDGATEENNMLKSSDDTPIRKSDIPKDEFKDEEKKSGLHEGRLEKQTISPYQYNQEDVGVEAKEKDETSDQVTPKNVRENEKLESKGMEKSDSSVSRNKYSKKDKDLDLAKPPTNNESKTDSTNRK